ncbi:Uncharacterised protein [Shigella sonnei]|nr:Uncharacterised protein [Shigella sonnei]CSE34836.1 Uncharacterised protein [Shigella sonnei]CSE40340.1 Uncharacterised protein [Shigella sonnei]CSE84469.1 Uncharacterised protein [Shigella sonnei]CSE90878.1 Uncharacterised protein [Shigella sonnei]
MPSTEGGSVGKSISEQGSFSFNQRHSLSSARPKQAGIRIISQVLATGISASSNSGQFSSLSRKRAIFTARNSVALLRRTSSSGSSISAVSTERSSSRNEAAARCAWKSISPLIPTTHIFFAGSGQTGTSGELNQVARKVPSGVTR